MLEIDSSAENLKIPENWEFRGRNEPGLKVAQIDLEERFLAYTLPDQTDTLRFNFSSDIFFGSDGKPVNIRTNDFLHSSIHIFSGNSDVQSLCTISGEIQDDYSKKRIIMLGSLFEVNSSAPSRLSDTILSDTLGGGDYSWDGAEHLAFKLGTGELLDLERVTLVHFNQREKKIMEESPVISFQPNSIFRGKIKYEYFRDKNFIALEQDEINNLSFLNDKGENIYKLDWKIEQQREDEKVFVVRYMHVPSDSVKILQVPLSVDPKKVASAILSKPPYPKDEKGRLIVPWTNIDRIVGASLSYSYPPPQSK